MRATVRTRPRPVYLSGLPVVLSPDELPPTPYAPPYAPTVTPPLVVLPPPPPRALAAPPLPAWDAAARARAAASMIALARTKYGRTLSAATAAQMVAKPTHGAAWAAFYAWGRNGVAALPAVIKLPPTGKPGQNDTIKPGTATTTAGEPSMLDEAVASLSVQTGGISKTVLLGGAGLALFLITRSDKKK